MKLTDLTYFCHILIPLSTEILNSPHIHYIIYIILGVFIFFATTSISTRNDPTIEVKPKEVQPRGLLDTDRLGLLFQRHIGRTVRDAGINFGTPEDYDSVTAK